MNNFIRQISLITLIALCLTSLSVQAVEELFSATYKGRHTGLGITLVRTLSNKSEGEFTLHSRATSFIGSITETSNFSVTGEDYRPRDYSYIRKVFGRKSEQQLTFNWEKFTASFRRSDKPKKNADYDIQTGVLDPSLYQLKLQRDVSRGQTRFAYTFAKDSRIKTFEFELSGQTTFRLGETTYDAVEVTRINQPDQRQTRILLLPALAYQIASIHHVENDGSKYNIKLIEFSTVAANLEKFYLNISESP